MHACLVRLLLFIHLDDDLILWISACWHKHIRTAAKWLLLNSITRLQSFVRFSQKFLHNRILYATVSQPPASSHSRTHTQACDRAPVFPVNTGLHRLLFPQIDYLDLCVFFFLRFPFSRLIVVVGELGDFVFLSHSRYSKKKRRNICPIQTEHKIHITMHLTTTRTETSKIDTFKRRRKKSVMKIFNFHWTISKGFLLLWQCCLLALFDGSLLICFWWHLVFFLEMMLMDA